ncbi:hypothetical protein ABZW03_08005 [Kitasatospora sp. NPDC004799]|uniref:hypothetical protein n=1 Tax=Kitasatospora sp. NPDC004799 TaxID=3154460 RepID=UPI0033BA34B3
MTSPATPDTFDGLLREVMADAERFGHRQHVRLTWLAVRRHGAPAALDLVGEGIRRTATKAGAPQKFHVTMTRAWVELVASHADDSRTDGDRPDDATAFERFAARHPELLDKDLLARHYRPQTLAGERARTAWVEPDLAPFPRRAQPS